MSVCFVLLFFFQAEAGIRVLPGTGVQPCALPILSHLRQDGLLPPSFAVIGVARERLDDTSFRAAMRHALDEFAGDGGKPEVAHSLCERLFYVPGDLDNARSEEHTSELQSQSNLVCRLLLEKKNKRTRL